MKEIEQISAVATVAPMASQVMPTPQQLLQRMSAAAAALWTVSNSGRPCDAADAVRWLLWCKSLQRRSVHWKAWWTVRCLCRLTSFMNGAYGRSNSRAKSSRRRIRSSRRRRSATCTLSTAFCADPIKPLLVESSKLVRNSDTGMAWHAALI